MISSTFVVYVIYNVMSIYSKIKSSTCLHVYSANSLLSIISASGIYLFRINISSLLMNFIIISCTVSVIINVYTTDNTAALC